MSILERKVQERRASSGSSQGQEGKAAGDVTTYGDRGWSLVVGQRGDAPQDFQELVEKGYRQNPIVSGAVRMIASAVSDAPLQAEIKTTSGAWKPVDETHPAQRLIDRPNTRDSEVEFIERSVVHYLLGGNTFWRIDRENGQPAQLIPIRPDKITKAATDKNNVPQVFSHNKEDTAQPEPIVARNMVHIRDIHPMNEIFGLPRLLSASLEIRTDNEASDYISEVLNNHGHPGLIIGIDKQAAKRKNIKRAQEFFEEEFGPGRGRGKTAMIAGASNIRVVGFNLRDLEFPDLRVVTRESIAAAMGVDPIMLGLGTASRGGTLSGNEAQEARKKLWHQTILPMIRRWESKLDHSLATQFDEEIRFRFDRASVQALKPDRNDAIERATEMSNAGAFSPEEIRREIGLEGAPEGDTIIHPNTKLVSPSSAVFGDPEPGVNVDDSEEEGQEGPPDDIDEDSDQISDYPLDEA